MRLPDRALSKGEDILIQFSSQAIYSFEELQRHNYSQEMIRPLSSLLFSRMNDLFSYLDIQASNPLLEVLSFHYADEDSSSYHF